MPEGNFLRAQQPYFSDGFRDGCGAIVFGGNRKNFVLSILPEQKPKAGRSRIGSKHAGERAPRLWMMTKHLCKKKRGQSGSISENFVCRTGSRILHKHSDLVCQCLNVCKKVGRTNQPEIARRQFLKEKWNG